MITINNCHCKTKWEVLKAHVRGCIKDWKELDRICIFAEEMPLKSVFSYKTPETLLRDHILKAAQQGKFIDEVKYS